MGEKMTTRVGGSDDPREGLEAVVALRWTLEALEAAQVENAFVAGWSWAKIAEVLGTINGKIILSVLFFVFLFPIALLYRLMTKNPMAIRHSPEDSFYTERNHTYKKIDLEHPW